MHVVKKGVKDCDKFKIYTYERHFFLSVLFVVVVNDLNEIQQRKMIAQTKEKRVIK